MLGHIDLKGHDAIKRVYDPNHVGPTLTTMGGGHREPKIAEVRSIGNTNPSGNGMNGQVYDIDAGLSPTLTTNKGEDPKVGGLHPCEICNGQGKITEYSNEFGEELLGASDYTCVDCYGSGIDDLLDTASANSLHSSASAYKAFRTRLTKRYRQMASAIRNFTNKPEMRSL